jgi:hypothetical protein
VGSGSYGLVHFEPKEWIVADDRFRDLLPIHFRGAPLDRAESFLVVFGKRNDSTREL